ncbi:MAG: cation transporter [Mangrovicoccus sp.]|nr:cation transporter [Mangrovicoccus sp.]
MQDPVSIERHSLNTAKWANLFMAFAGIAAGILANADALLLDGLFSGLNFVTAIIAARVAVSITRAPDANRPWGYEVDETVFVMFRGLLLIGIIAMAFFSSLSRIIIYWQTGEASPVELGWITGYVGLMVVACFGLYFYHKRNWRLSGRSSTLLETEAKAALVDGLLSAGAGLAFLAIALLRGGPLEMLIPISDAIVVVVMCLAMIPQPIGIFRQALRDLIGVGLPPETVASLTREAENILAARPFEVLRVAPVRNGRNLFHLVYLKPEGAVGIEEIEAARADLVAAAAPDRVEITLAKAAPY